MLGPDTSVGVLIGVLVSSTFGTASAEGTINADPYGPYGLNCTDEIVSIGAGACIFFTITSEETVRVFSRSSNVVPTLPVPASGTQFRGFAIAGVSAETTEVCVESPDGAYITCDTVVV